LAASSAVKTNRSTKPPAAERSPSARDLPGKWQAAIVEAEQNRPKLGVVGA